MPAAPRPPGPPRYDAHGTGPTGFAALLSGLAEANDDRLVRVVELLDRLPDRGAADRVLDPVRPRLAGLRPPRPLTLSRVLVLPFEDLLVDPAAARPDRKRVSRVSLRPLLHLTLDGLAPGLARELDGLARAGDMRAADLVLRVGARLWPEAERALRGRLAGPATGGPDRAADDVPAPELAGVVGLLALGPELVPALWRLPPKPAVAYPPGTAAALAPVVAGARARGTETLLWLVELLAARSLGTAPVLDLVWDPGLALGPRDREACLRQLTRGCLADMRHAADRLGREEHRPTGEVVDGLIELATGLDTLDGAAVTGMVDRMLLRDVRVAASDVLARRLHRALGDEIAAELDALAAPAGLGDTEVERLEHLARAVRQLAIAGTQLSPGGGSEGLLPSFRDTYRARILARQPPGATGGRVPRDLLEQMRVFEILFGADAAAQLLDEARGGAGGKARSPGTGPARGGR